MASQKCGSVTSFRGKGKVRRIKLMLGEPKFVDFLSQVGRTFEFDEVSVSKSEEFVCSLYGKDLKHVKDARAALLRKANTWTTACHQTKIPWRSIFLGQIIKQTFITAALNPIQSSRRHRATDGQLMKMSSGLNGWISCQPPIQFLSWQTASK